MKKILLAVLPLCVMGMSSVAQQVKKCGIDEVMQQFEIAHPHAYAEARQREAEAQQLIPNTNEGAKGTAVVQIPVVFHLALTQAQFNRIGGVAGIEQRVDSQMAVLKRDFLANNPDLAQVPAVFNAVKGNAQIDFLLAHTRPDGQGTPGYQYKIIGAGDTIFNVSSGSYGSGYFVSDVKYPQKGFAAWDYTKYLNIWVCDIFGGSILGICTKPTLTGPNFGDIPYAERGVVLTYGAFGKRRNIGDFYIAGNDKGRTLVHELGHYFELNHIWGNNGSTCNDDDGVSDTPLQYDENFGCPSVGTVYPNCTNSPGGEMWMNYMDYVSDACMYMFSAGQVNRMKSQYDNNTKNSWSLTQNAHLGNWPAAIVDIAQQVQLRISPNPTNGQFVITYNATRSKLQHVTITNVLGQQVYNQALGNASPGKVVINMEHLSKGLYQVKVLFNDGQSTQKLLIQ